MTKETMTIAKALVELEELNRHINRNILYRTFCVANDHRHLNMCFGHITIEDAKNKIKSTYDETMVLINRKNAIEKAIIFSNAITKIKINNTEMTIAEAIYFKTNGLEDETTLFHVLNNQYNEALNILSQNNNSDLENNIIEGIDTKKTIEELKDKINKFETELDDIIAISNANTEITIEY